MLDYLIRLYDRMKADRKDEVPLMFSNGGCETLADAYDSVYRRLGKKARNCLENQWRYFIPESAGYYPEDIFDKAAILPSGIEEFRIITDTIKSRLVCIKPRSTLHIAVPLNPRGYQDRMVLTSGVVSGHSGGWDILKNGDSRFSFCFGQFEDDIPGRHPVLHKLTDIGGSYYHESGVEPEELQAYLDACKHDGSRVMVGGKPRGSVLVADLFYVEPHTAFAYVY